MSKSITIAPMASIVLALGLACAIQGVVSDPHPWADNVCNKSVPVKKDIVIEQPVQYEIKVESMCGILPCTKTRIETRQDESIKTIIVREERATCCDGYAETPSRQCAPICLDSCHGGKCVAPNVCKCHPEPSESAPGFVGPTCKRFVCLMSQRWGPKCEHKCPTVCPQNAYCSANTGKCLCYPGWRGDDCNLECDPNSDADDCPEVSNRFPAVMEPEANLFLLNELPPLSRSQRPQALTLTADSEEVTNDSGVRIVPSASSPDQAWAASLASTYLIVILSLVSIISLVGFLIVRRRFELVRNELYYASAASAISERSGRPGSGSDYSTGGSSSDDYSTTGRPGSAISSEGGDLEKNISFAAATRSILTGVVGGVTGHKLSPGEETTKRDKLLLFAPRVESHLITSQRQSEQNIYSEMDIAKRLTPNAVAVRPQAELPSWNAPAAAADHAVNQDGDNIYAVPKNQLVVEGDKGEKGNPYDTTLDMEKDCEWPIYEEIKPRARDSKQL